MPTVGGVDLALGPSSPEVTTQYDRDIVLQSTGRKSNKLDQGTRRSRQNGPARDPSDLVVACVTEESIRRDDQRGAPDGACVNGERDAPVADEWLSNLPTREVDDVVADEPCPGITDAAARDASWIDGQDDSSRLSTPELHDVSIQRFDQRFPIGSLRVDRADRVNECLRRMRAVACAACAVGQGDHDTPRTYEHMCTVLAEALRRRDFDSVREPMCHHVLLVSKHVPA